MHIAQISLGKVGLGHKVTEFENLLFATNRRITSICMFQLAHCLTFPSPPFMLEYLCRTTGSDVADGRQDTELLPDLKAWVK